MKKFFPASVLLIAVTVIVSSFIIRRDNLGASVPETGTKNLAAKWVLDKGHSNVKFTVTHMVVSEVEGSFKNFEGTVESSKPDFSDAVITFTVDVNSVDTDNERRDNHLKSDDFFNAEKFPQMKFQSTSFKPLGGKKYKLDGNLTIRDVTKPVSFDVTFGGTLDTKRDIVAGFKASTTINRFDYNLKWDRATEAGGLVVAKDVVVSINGEFKQAKEQAK